MLDDRNRTVNHYPDSPDILKTLSKEGYDLAVASRTGAIEEANSLLKLFEWKKYFKYKEIYPGSKLAHFRRYICRLRFCRKDRDKRRWQKKNCSSQNDICTKLLGKFFF